MTAPAFQLLHNPNHGVPGLVTLPEGGFRRARAAIAAWPNYCLAEARALPELARAAGVAALHHLPAAPLREVGTAFAATRALLSALARGGVAAQADAAALESGALRHLTGQVTLACRVGPAEPWDGFSEALAVARAARRFGAGCAALVSPATPEPLREDLLAEGAALHETGGTAASAHALAEAQGWQLISDLAVPGFTEPPRDVMQGYRVAVAGALAPLSEEPTHLLVAAGSGALATAAAAALRANPGTPVPPLILLEPAGAAPFLALAAGQGGDTEGATSLLAWGELGRSVNAFLVLRAGACGGLDAASLPDDLAALLAARPAADALRQALGIDGASRLLVIGG
ncbi:pyridoxal-phosphate dependent enzyme [Roseomonas elaeocarpi]|uniref:Pyridoxal-phosphate dependent enzyme n=1 Tax=Roseomonas elaeocarpi TaxID=907779 RepID=A0ABV6JPA3_9PROT